MPYVAISRPSAGGARSGSPTTSSQPCPHDHGGRWRWTCSRTKRDARKAHDALSALVPQGISFPISGTNNFAPHQALSEPSLVPVSHFLARHSGCQAPPAGKAHSAYVPAGLTEHLERKRSRLFRQCSRLGTARAQMRRATLCGGDDDSQSRTSSALAWRQPDAAGCEQGLASEVPRACARARHD